MFLKFPRAHYCGLRHVPQNTVQDHRSPIRARLQAFREQQLAIIVDFTHSSNQVIDVIPSVPTAWKTPHQSIGHNPNPIGFKRARLGVAVSLVLVLSVLLLLRCAVTLVCKTPLSALVNTRTFSHHATSGRCSLAPANLHLRVSRRLRSSRLTTPTSLQLHTPLLCGGPHLRGASDPSGQPARCALCVFAQPTRARRSIQDTTP